MGFLCFIHIVKKKRYQKIILKIYFFFEWILARNFYCNFGVPHQAIFADYLP